MKLYWINKYDAGCLTYKECDRVSEQMAFFPNGRREKLRSDFRTYSTSVAGAVTFQETALEHEFNRLRSACDKADKELRSFRQRIAAGQFSEESAKEYS